jgi:hypothetical protein
VFCAEHQSKNPLRSDRHGIAETETLLPDDAGDAVAETELDLRTSEMEARQYEVFSAMCISDEDQPLLEGDC